MGLKTRAQRGIELEEKYSRLVHRDNHKFSYPLLIDAKLLRDFGAGQIDLCAIEKTQKYGFVIKIYEVKSFANISSIQWMRLKKSADLLSYLFDLPTKIEVLYDDF